MVLAVLDERLSPILALLIAALVDKFLVLRIGHLKLVDIVGRQVVEYKSDKIDKLGAAALRNMNHSWRGSSRRKCELHCVACEGCNKKLPCPCLGESPAKIAVWNYNAR